MSPSIQSLAVFGPGAATASFALRKVLKFKECQGPLVVLDYTGRGAAALTEHNAMNLHKRPVTWLDLADRHRPVGLFSLQRSGHFRQVFLGVLWSLRATSGVPASDATLEWACEAAWQLSKDGAVSLQALLKTLYNDTARRWFLDTQKDPADFGRILKILVWALRFPAVYALSEAGNRVSLLEALRTPQTVWLEAHAEHFESCEYALLLALIEAVVEDALRAWGAEQNPGQPKDIPTLLHLFPRFARPEGYPAWIRDTSMFTRHVGVFRLEAQRGLSHNALAWAQGADQIWILGGIHDINPEAHRAWLREDDIAHINRMERSSLLLKVNGNPVISARVANPEFSLSTAHVLRSQSARLRKVLPIRQLSTAVGALSAAENSRDGLYQQLCHKETIRSGWLRVQTAKKTSHGVDNVTVEAFKENLEEELSKLSDELASRTYRCRPLLRTFIPKSDGGLRPLGIACIRDRVVMSACLSLIEPLFEPSFSHFSYAFRPYRNCHQALALVRSLIASGRTWAVVADIRKCFDNLDHEVLMGFVAKKVGDPAILDLIHHWLVVDVLHFGDMIPTDIGVPQGESMSPLLANVYLDPFDKHMERLGYPFVRYADDIIILANEEGGAKKALEQMADFLHAPLHLELKPAKTNYVAIQEGFDFLGFRVFLDRMEIQKTKLDRVVELLRGHMKALGEPKSSLDERAKAIFRINAVIRGFWNYFGLVGEPKIAEQMIYLDGRVEQMAHYYLPLAIRDDPAWICRERFTLLRKGEDDEPSEKSGAPLSTATDGYPQDSRQTTTPGWMTKGSPKDSAIPKRGKPTLVVEDPSEPESPEKPMKWEPSVVDLDERLYVLTHGSYLALMGEDLVVRKRQVEVHRRALSDLGLVFLQGFGMNISVDLQLKLAERDIPVVFAPPLGGQMAILNPVRTEKSHVRAQQVLRRDDSDIITTGLDMLSAKVGNQAAVLQYFAKYRRKADPEVGKRLIESAEDLKKLAASIRVLDPSQSEVRPMAMGYEGHAAAEYWQCLSRLAPDDLGFEGRVTRNASDVVNQCINYVYGMLYGEVWRALVKQGLDPYFGFVHGSKRNQGSLVFDVIEEFRAPFADRFVFGMFGRGFKPVVGEHAHLRTESRMHLAKGFIKRWILPIAWRSRMISPAKILDHQAASLVKLIKREGKYHPFRMRW